MDNKKITEKHECVTRLNELKGQEASQRMIALIDILIEEIRETNDTEQEMVSIYRNQGKITELVQLKKYITDGYPKRPSMQYKDIGS